MAARDGNPMTALDFFSAAPVFTHEEFLVAHAQAKGRSRHTSNNLLALHLAAGRLVRVRRGLYATVPRGVDQKAAVVDPYLVATKLADDAVVAYHAGAARFASARPSSSPFSSLPRCASSQMPVEALSNNDMQAGWFG